jgi:Ca2+/Na+ antiporter
VRRGGFGSYANGIVIQFLSVLGAAFLLTWLHLQARDLSYARRVLFLTVVGLAAGVIVCLPDWNWWGFSGVYTLVNVADFTLMWFFAGLVIAKVAKPQPPSAAQ